MFKKWRVLAAAAFLIAMPGVALAARGYATNDVNLRAGPGVGYPVVDTIPSGAHIDIHGCLNTGSWCDVSWDGNRGWVAAAYLDYFYNNRYVYLPDYVAEIDIPVVTFSVGTYWSDYYVGRPWYHRRAYWLRYSHRHRPHFVRNSHHHHFAGGHHDHFVHSGNRGPNHHRSQNAQGSMTSANHRHGQNGHHDHAQFLHHGRNAVNGPHLSRHHGRPHYARHHGAPHFANHAGHVVKHPGMAHAGRMPPAAMHAHASAPARIGGGHGGAPHFNGGGRHGSGQRHGGSRHHS